MAKLSPACPELGTAQPQLVWQFITGSHDLDQISLPGIGIGWPGRLEWSLSFIWQHVSYNLGLELGNGQRHSYKFLKLDRCNVDRLRILRTPLPLEGDFSNVWSGIGKVIDPLHVKNHKVISIIIVQHFEILNKIPCFSDLSVKRFMHQLRFLRSTPRRI